MMRKDSETPSVKNPKLKSAMRDVIADNSQSNQNALVDELLNSYFYLLVDFKQGEDEISSVTMLRSISDKEESYLPVFSDEDEMKKNQEISGFESILVDFNELFEIVTTNQMDFSGFIVNPDSDEIIIDNELLMYIKETKLNPEKNHKVVIREAEQYEVTDLSQDIYPTEMIEALKKYFESNQQISKAYITYITQDNTSSYLLITDFEGDKDEIFAQISQVAKPYLYKVFLDQLDYDTKFAKEITANLKPFYRKKVFGIF